MNIEYWILSIGYWIWNREYGIGNREYAGPAVVRQRLSCLASSVAPAQCPRDRDFYYLTNHERQRMPVPTPTVGHDPPATYASLSTVMPASSSSYPSFTSSSIAFGDPPWSTLPSGAVDEQVSLLPPPPPHRHAPSRSFIQHRFILASVYFLPPVRCCIPTYSLPSPPTSLAHHGRHGEN